MSTPSQPTAGHHLVPAGMSARERRRLFAAGLLRSVAIVVFLMTWYYLAPLDHFGWLSLGVALLIGVAVVAFVAFYEVRAVLRSPYPAIRAVEALAAIVFFFLVLFSIVYYVLERDSSTAFNVASLTRTDALYFTVTTFSTVGYGDIAAASQTARLVVVVQIVLDLILLGLGLRVLVSAVQIARSRQGPNEAVAQADLGAPPPPETPGGRAGGP
jgi:voltage-gated potassium channel